MVQIIEENKPSFARSILGGVAEGLPSAIQTYQENQALKKRYGLDLTGVSDPATRQQLIADQLKFGRSMKQAAASTNVKYSPELREEKPQPEKPPKRIREPGEKFERPSKSKLPSFATKEEIQEEIPAKDEFSTSILPQKKGIGSIPEEATAGEKIPEMSPIEIEQLGDQIARDRTLNQNIPTSKEEGMIIAQQLANERALYNQRIDQQRSANIQVQNEYGQLGEQALIGSYPGANDELKALFNRKGIELGNTTKDQAKIRKELAIEAKNFVNNLSAIENEIPSPPRIYTKAWEALQGSSRNKEERERSIKNKLKPLLDEGLFDTARRLLATRGYGPEETEGLISSISEPAKKQISQLPKLQKKVGTYEERFKEYLTPEKVDLFRNNLQQVLNSDPNTNLILLRKEYEKKGIDWDIFKNSIDELIENGQFKPNEDQFKYLTNLDYPPLTNLQKILHGLDLRGR